MTNRSSILTPPPPLSEAQLGLVERPLEGSIFLEGPAGTGKTTTAIERLLYLMDQGVSGDQILLFLPHRVLAAPYLEALRTPGAVAGGEVSVLTIAGLAQQMIGRYWPQISAEAAFAHPNRPPVFLNFEAAQYTMARLVRPLLDEGRFESVTLDLNWLYSQLLENLNRAAEVGFPVEEIGERLKSAWVGDPGQARVYEDVQFCASLFRRFCLEHNLLDFSLQIEVFRKYVWPLPACQEALSRAYRHLIVDNLEEDVPVAHDLLREWLPRFTSALLVYDWDAGFRRLLGADPVTAYALKDMCPEQVAFHVSFVTSGPVRALEDNLRQFLLPVALPAGGSSAADFASPDQPGHASGARVLSALAAESYRYYPQMLDWVAAQVAVLVNEEGLPPDEIVVLAPFLPDSLRFALTSRLEAYQIPTHSQRPSRSLWDEPVTQCVLTLAALAHPGWRMAPAKFDVSYALVQAIAGMDLVRAQMLTEIVYRNWKDVPRLSAFQRIKTPFRERITPELGERFDALRLWLAEYSQGAPEELDTFIERLFDEVLTRPEFGFYGNPKAAETVANLIDSIRNFQSAVGGTLAPEGRLLGKEYLQVMREGLLSAQYLRSWHSPPAGSVLLAPVYTYLLSNRPVEVQFWLDVGSRGWFERLGQPLTHPYVLSRQWPEGKVWTDMEEYLADQDALYRLVTGLLRRCRRKIYLGISELNDQGYEQRGQLLRLYQRLFQVHQDGGSDSRSEGVE